MAISKYTMGVVLTICISIIAFFISKIDFIQAIGFSPLVIGIVLGMVYANTISHKYTNIMGDGVTFCAKKVLRFAIVFYGFRITFQEVAQVGLDGFFVSLVMIATTMIIGIYVGHKIFKLEKDTSILIASGGAVCGAAAVLATESSLKSQEYKAILAVSMVVLFGTLSMFLYPILYTYIIQPATGFLHMSPEEFGIYVGGSVHEVAQVIAIPNSIQNTPAQMADSAVIVKLTRVILLAPMLIFIGIYLKYSSDNTSTSNKIVIPWFAVYFIVVVGIHSLNIIPKNIVNIINHIDTFLLTMAMTALGINTVFSKFKNLGAKPIYAAGIMFIWLVVGGFIVVKTII